MAFPAVQGTPTESLEGSLVSTHDVTLPTGVVAGELLLVIGAMGSTAVTLNALGGWSELIDENVARGLKVLYRYADGTEGGTVVTFTSSATNRSAWIAYRIAGATNPANRTPEISAVATGTSQAPDPGTCTPTGGAKDYLWLTCFTLAGEEADDDTWCNNAATGYGNLLQKTSGTGGTNVGASLAVSYRTNNAASENAVWPAASIDASLAWRAFTIAIHPSTAGGRSTAIKQVIAAAGDVTGATVGTLSTAAYWRTLTVAFKPISAVVPVETTGTAAADTRVSGVSAKSTIYPKAGQARAGSRASAADVFEATEAGSARVDTRASGADAFTATETGQARAGTRSSGADVFTAAETGSARAGTRSSAADVFTASETGSALVDTRASAADALVTTETGQARAGSRASGADLFEATETGSVFVDTTASGASEHSVGGFTYEKAGIAAAGTRASAVDVYAASRTGIAAAGSRDSAADTFTASETASPTVDTQASAADTFTATETGSVFVDTRVSGASQHDIPGLAQKSGYAAAGTRASAPDVFTAIETGQVRVGTRASGASLYIPPQVAAKSGIAAVGTRASGVSVHVPSAVYAKSGLAAAGALAGGADVYISTEIGLAVLGTIMDADAVAMRARAGLGAVGTRASGTTPGLFAIAVAVGLSSPTSAALATLAGVTSVIGTNARVEDDATFADVELASAGASVAETAHTTGGSI